MAVLSPEEIDALDVGQAPTPPQAPAPANAPTRQLNYQEIDNLPTDVPAPPPAPEQPVDMEAFQRDIQQRVPIAQSAPIEGEGRQFPSTVGEFGRDIGKISRMTKGAALDVIQTGENLGALAPRISTENLRAAEQNPPELTPKLVLPREAEVARRIREEGASPWTYLPERIAGGLAASAPKIAGVVATGELTGGTGAVSLLAEMIAAGGLFSLDDQGNFSLKEGLIGAAIPAVGKLGAKAVSVALGRALAAGWKVPIGGTAQKLLETLGEQSALDAYQLGMHSPELAQLAQTDPAEFKRQIAETIGSNMAFALFGAGKYHPDIPSETKAWVTKNANTLATKTVLESYSPEDLRDIYSRVNAGMPATKAEKDLVTMINTTLGKPGEAIKQGVDIIEQGWPERLAKMMGAKVAGKTVQVRGAGAAPVQPRGRSMRFLTNGEIDAIDTEQQQTGVPGQPAGTPTVGQTGPEAGAGNSVQGPAGQPGAPQGGTGAPPPVVPPPGPVAPVLPAPSQQLNPPPEELSDEEQEKRAEARRAEFRKARNGPAPGYREPSEMTPAEIKAEEDRIYSKPGNEWVIKDPHDRAWLDAVEHGSYAKAKAAIEATEARWRKEAEDAGRRWYENFRKQQGHAPPPSSDDLVKKAIAHAKQNGPSPEFRAFFGGIDPVVAGTTPEKVRAFAASLGMEWHPVTAPEAAPTPKPVESAHLTPAVRMGEGKPVTGGLTHDEVVRNNPTILLEGEGEPERGFIDDKGNWVTREQGSDWFVRKTGKQPATPGQLHSEDLRDAGLLQHLNPVSRDTLPRLMEIQRLYPDLSIPEAAVLNNAITEAQKNLAAYTTPGEAIQKEAIRLAAPTGVPLTKIATLKLAKEIADRYLTVPKPAPKPEPPKSKWKPIGKNRYGHELFEDDNGVRSYVDNGIRSTEAVGIIPGGGISVKAVEDKDSHYVTQEELDARTPKGTTLEQLKAEEERIYNERPKPLPKSKEGDVAARSAHDKAMAEWHVRYAAAVKATAAVEDKDKPKWSPLKETPPPSKQEALDVAYNFWLPEVEKSINAVLSGAKDPHDARVVHQGPVILARLANFAELGDVERWKREQGPVSKVSQQALISSVTGANTNWDAVKAEASHYRAHVAAIRADLEAIKAGKPTPSSLKEAPSPNGKLPDKWTEADVHGFIKGIEDGQLIFWGGNDLGLPPFQSIPNLEHRGYGMFTAKGPGYEISVDGGGSMQRTEGGVPYTIAQVTGTYPYDKEGVLKTLRGFLPEKKPATPAGPKIEVIHIGGPTTAKPKTEVKSPLANLSEEKQKRAEELKKQLLDKFKNIGKTPMSINPNPLTPLDPESLKAAAELAQLYVEGGVKTFEQFAKSVKEDMPSIWDRIKAYLRAVWNAIAEAMGFDEVTREEAQSAIERAERGTEFAPPPEVKDTRSPSAKVAQFVNDRLANGQGFTSKELFEQGDKAWGKSQAEGGYSVKDAYDAMEMGVNQYIRSQPDRFSTNGDAAWATGVVSDLKDIISKLPTQSARTAEMDKMQQFSTPPPFAYVAGWVAKPHKGDVMLEPSIGPGGVAVFPKNAGAYVIGNELSERRLAIAAESGITDKILNLNAEHLHALLEPLIANGTIRRPTLVEMNPPFSNAAVSGETKNSMIGAKHVEEALKLLAPGGRLVAIVGQGMAMDRATFKEWWKRIMRDYNVRANIGVSGDEYRKYGTAFGNQILVIDKTGTTIGQPVTGQVEKLEELIPLLEAIRNERPTAESTPAKPGGAPPTPPGTPATGTGVGTSTAPRPGGTGGGRPRPGGSGSGGVRNKPGSPKPGDANVGEGSNAGGSGEPSTTQTSGQDVSDAQTAAAEGMTVEQLHQGQRELNEHGVFAEYHPSKVKIPGAQKHPTPLVEPTAMASVESPDPTYTPNIPKSLVTSGALSEAQLEALVYAGMAHAKFLPTGERLGFFIGDGTGVGKGREIGGVDLDNWLSGRKKHVWVSKTGNLFNDAKRDLGALGFDTSKLHNISKLGSKGLAAQTEGIAYTTYSGLSRDNPGLKPTPQLEPGEKRPTPTLERYTGRGKEPWIKVLADWLGDPETFDGVIAFDEAHLAGNAIDVKGTRGMKKASERGKTVVQLQQMFPKARILYVSATGATDVTNLSYADRLGIWGHGTPFPTKSAFFNAIKAGGLSAMEIVARDLKSMGRYIARTLSFEGVEQVQLEHKLSEDQKKIYNEGARAWQLVFGEVDNSMAQTGQGNNGFARGQSMSKLYGAQQRFFNTLLTAMQMPTVLADAKQRLEEGHAVLMQVVNTGDASLKRELAKKGTDEEMDLETLDLSPKDIILQYIENCFPTTLFHPVADDEGNITWRPVLDADGNTVDDPAALAAKQALMDKLATLNMPQNPLDMVMDTFGVENVAEVTGRSKRVVQVKQPDGTRKRVLESRSEVLNKADSEAYQDDKKKVLVFSDAGGTGFSYHASRKVKNQRRRYHYLIQAGWKADTALQGMGRSHRADQAHSPFYKLAHTDLKGHQRFISTIARRLSEMGALIGGERESTKRGLFDETNNLENQYAEDAVMRLFFDLFANRVEGFSFDDITAKLGFVRSVRDSETGEIETVSTLKSEDGQLIADKIPTIQQFLNRILALEYTDQNGLFEEFMQRMLRRIENAKADGSYDPGTQVLKALSIRKLSDEVVYEHPESTAKTRLVEVESDHPTITNKWEDIDTIAPSEKVAGFVQNKQSKKIYALKLGPVRTLESGSLVQTWRRISTTSTDIKPQSDIKTENYYEPGVGYKEPNYDVITDVNAAREEWRRQLDAAPKTYTQRDTYVVGAFLPIWDRLQLSNPKIWRITTDDKETFLGAHVPPDAVGALRSRMGAGKGAKLTAEQAFDQITNDNVRIPLSNGWTLKRTMRSGENRIEVLGVELNATGEFTNYIGGYIERIDFRPRFFIPTDRVAGIEALDKILKKAPPVEDSGEAQGSLPSEAPTPLVEPGPEPQRGTFKAYNLDQLREALPHIGLAPEAERLLTEFLKLPVAKLLNGLQVKISDVLDGGWQGSYLSNLVELARNASPETGPEELLHAVWELLPAEMQAEFERMRVASLEALIKESEGQPQRQKVFQDLIDNPSSGGDDYMSRKYPVAVRGEAYAYSNASEFFAKSGSRRFARKVGSMQKGFWDRVKDFIRNIIGALKRALRLKPTQAEMLDRVMRGDFEPSREPTENIEKQATYNEKITETESDAVPGVPSGRLTIAVRFPNGEVRKGRANEAMHAQIYERLWREKHRNMVSERDPEIESGWVDSTGKFWTNDEVQKEVGYKPDSFGSGGIQIPRKLQASLSREQTIEEGEKSGSIPTKVFGEEYYVADREQITPDTIEASADDAKAALDDSGIPATERKSVDDRGRDVRVWVMDPQGRDMTAEGKRLLTRLKADIGKAPPGKAGQEVANLLNSIVTNFAMGPQSAMGEMQPAIRNELWAAAQSDRSARGIALAALYGVPEDLKFIGRNVDVELGKIWSDAFGGDELRRTLDELEQARADYAEAIKRGDDLAAANAELQKALEAALKKKGRKGLNKILKIGGLNSKILDLIKQGKGAPWDILKAMAEAQGWKIPSDDDLMRMKRWADEWEALEHLSDAEKARAGNKAAQAAALRMKMATTENRRIELRKQIETLWHRLTRPWTLRNATGRANVVNALSEWVSANLLLKVGFATRQTVDVLTQGALYTPTRAVGHAMGVHEAEVEAGRRSRFDYSPAIADAGNAIKQAYYQRTRALKATLSMVSEVMRGKDQGRHVARLMGRVSIFDRMMQKADELAAQGKTGEAFAMRALTWMRLGYRVAQAMDNLHGQPAVYQEMRQQTVAACREAGMTRAEAEAKADWVMDVNRDEVALAQAEAAEWLSSSGIAVDEKALKAATFRLLQAKMYEKMRSLKFPADDFEGRNLELLDTLGWNEKEEGGLGGAVATTLRKFGNVSMKAFAEHPITAPVTLPMIPLTRFANAIGILINRKATWLGLGFFPGAFGVSDAKIDEHGIAHGGSPWYRTAEDRRQRKVEAATGLATQIIFAMLAAAGYITVRLAWPKDKAEREKWDKLGWRPGQVAIPTGDGKHVTFSMNTGPLVVMSPGLSAGGALRNKLDERAAKQKALDDAAAKAGLPPGKIRPMDVADWMGVAGQAAWGAVISGRTLSGLVSSVTDAGQLHPIKGVANEISAFTPTLPGFQELARMATGTVLNSQTASIWDFLMPLPSSGAAQVNILGDKVGDANGLQRVVSILTGGNYPFPVSDKDREGTASYRALFESGYRPPAIDANKNYAIGGQFRPLTDAELAKYAQLRGQNFKEGLQTVDPGDKVAAQAAYRDANNSALETVGADLGATRPSPKGRTPSVASAASAPGVNLASLSGVGPRGSARGRSLGGGRRKGAFGGAFSRARTFGASGSSRRPKMASYRTTFSRLRKPRVGALR